MKVLLVATVQSHICQFHRPLAEVLHEQGAELHVCARNNLAEKNGLTLDFAEKVYDVPFQRSPFSPVNLRAYRRLKEIIDTGDYDVVHCNTPVGGVLGRLAAASARKKGTKVFYTAHGFHFYKGAPVKNWMIWYPVERFMSRFCDTLITITKEDYRLVRKRFRCGSAHMHGVGVSDLRYHPVSSEESVVMRAEEKLTPEDFVILCVGELNANKNQDKLIAAASKLLEEIPELQILLAGNGAREVEYREQIRSLGLDDHVKMLGYRTDLEKITPAVDLVVSCSHREGLPLNILEAMLCKIPVVASHNRGHDELVRDGVNGFLVDADDVDGYVEKIKGLHSDKAKRSEFGSKGYTLGRAYSVPHVKEELRRIYQSIG